MNHNNEPQDRSQGLRPRDQQGPRYQSTTLRSTDRLPEIDHAIKARDQD